jgi:YfiH family protein
MKPFTLRQIHSAIARVVEPGTAAGLRGDILLTARAGLLVGVKTADCLPVLLVDARRRVVSAVHAGWRGLVRRVVEKAAGEMRRHFGCEPADLHAAIGPGIQACCFEVGPEVLAEFHSQFPDAEVYCRREAPNPALTILPRQIMTYPPLPLDLDTGRGHIDLAEAVRRQLLAAGVDRRRIYNSGKCTACDLRMFYSYRREKEAAGRMLAVVGVRPNGVRFSAQRRASARRRAG